MTTTTSSLHNHNAASRLLYYTANEIRPRGYTVIVCLLACFWYFLIERGENKLAFILFVDFVVHLPF